MAVTDKDNAKDDGNDLGLVQSKTESKPESKTESKKQEKTQDIKPIYPRYAGYSCPVCGSKRVTDSAGNYLCPVTPKPSDCPIK